MDTLYADIMGRAICQFDGQHPLAHNGVFKLANLIALRQIGIKIIFAIKNAIQVNLCLDTQPGFYRLAHTGLVNHRQHTRHSRIHQRYIFIWPCPESGG